MTKLVSVAGALFVAVLAAGCPPAHVPGPADTAAYLGLSAGDTITFGNDAGDHLGETLEVRTSSVLPLADNPDGLVFDLIEKKETGFAVDERTLSLEVLVAGARVRQFFDCISKCGLPSEPVDMGAVPFKGGSSTQTEVDVALTVGGVESTAHETHLFVIGDAAPVTVPAGEFDAFSVSWTRTDDAGSATSILKIAENDGIVSWDGFDGAQLRRQ